MTVLVAVLCACVCACASNCVCACMRACVCAGACACVSVDVRACVPLYACVCVCFLLGEILCDTFVCTFVGLCDSLASAFCSLDMDALLGAQGGHPVGEAAGHTGGVPVPSCDLEQSLETILDEAHGHRSQIRAGITHVTYTHIALHMHVIRRALQSHWMVGHWMASHSRLRTALLIGCDLYACADAPFVPH
jgi:hypothetical protein